MSNLTESVVGLVFFATPGIPMYPFQEKTNLPFSVFCPLKPTTSGLNGGKKLRLNDFHPNVKTPTFEAIDRSRRTLVYILYIYIHTGMLEG